MKYHYSCDNCGYEDYYDVKLEYTECPLCLNGELILDFIDEGI